MSKYIIKKTINYIMNVFSFPFYIIYIIGQLFFTKRKIFTSVMQTVSLFPGVSGEWLRRGVLQWITKKKMNDSCISFGCTFSDPDVEIGDGVYIGAKCDIGKTIISNDCVIGSGVHILSGAKQHEFENTNIPIRHQKTHYENVNIGSNTWIGNNTVIMSDIGNNCVVGAGSVVVYPVEENSVVAGNPARLIRKRT